MDDDTPATFEDGSTTKTVPGEGTYTVAPDGTVTFVPEKSFTGEGTGVTVKRVDKNGTPVTAKYTNCDSSKPNSNSSYIRSTSRCGSNWNSNLH